MVIFKSLRPLFYKHKAEFGDISQSQYLKMAKEFSSEVGEHIREGRVGNIIVKHDPKTGRVLVGNAGSREIRTFYKDDGRDADAFEAAMELARELTRNQ